MTKKNTEQIGSLTLREDKVGGNVSGYWVVDIPPHVDGNSKRKRKRFPSKTSAKNYARQIVKQQQLVEHNTSKGVTGFTLNDVFERWHDNEKQKIAAGHKRQSSLRTDLNALSHILDYFGLTDIGVIDTERVLDYQVKRRGDGVKEVTVNTETRKLKAMMNWCHRKRLTKHTLHFDPLSEPRLPTEVPTLDEMVKILEELPFKLRVLMRTMLETGLRKSEAYNLCWDQIDIERKRIRIGVTDVFTPKTEGSNRTVIMGDGLKADLIKLKHGQESKSDWVFPSARNLEKPMDNCRKALTSAIKRSGVERFGKPMKFTPKYGRKAFSSYQWIKGIPLELIKKKLGHSPNSRVTEKHYLHLPDELMGENIVEMPL